MFDTIDRCRFTSAFPYDPEKPHRQPQPSPLPDGFPNHPEDWIHEFERFTSSDGVNELFAQLWRPRRWQGQNAHRVLVVFHGQGEHGGRYRHLTHYLKDDIGAIYALDHRGHGRSTGTRGHVAQFDQYGDDAALSILRLNEYLIERFGKSEINVLAHSMGGQVFLRAILNHETLPVRAAALSSPMFDLAFKVPWVKKIASEVLLRLTPNLAIPGEKLGPLVSKSGAVTTNYENDRLNHGFVTSAFYHSYLAAKDKTMADAARIKIPLFVQLAGADKIIDTASQLKFAQKLSSENHKHKVYDGLYHEIYNEPEKEMVIEDLIAWLDAHRSRDA